ncbi:ATP-binding protein [Marinobacter zhanjiangensis]|uniref:histidine kinase n=1 Tax=Marinobacter zhanjiangensis TaxID=578215 RepID=A0ABQ3AJW6_9GAMM|nr:ATP-binding protein [Marinobacter zhanjiangensis]GGY58782.1 proteobacterial dedicated sortase system histidine kinase [Marinobacter zhanjiangensis]
MSLKRQLFLASLLMLLIPWAGLQFVLELDQALRDQSASQLQTQARRMADVASSELEGTEPLTGDDSAIYIRQAHQPIKPDGHGDDWPGYQEGEQPWQTTADAEDVLAWQAAVHGRYLYLLLRVQRPDPLYYNPASPDQPHEFLRLRWRSDTLVNERIIRTSAPGQVVGRLPFSLGRQDHRLSGVWQSRGNGYQVELRLPRLQVGDELAMEVVWPDPDNPELLQTAGTRQYPLPVVTGRNPALEARLNTLLSSGQRVLVSEPAGWLIARSEQPLADNGPAFDSLSPLEVMEQITLNALRALVRFYQPEPASFRDEQTHRQTPDSGGLVRHPDNEVYLMATAPLADGRVLVLEQSLDQILALSGNTLGSVIARSVLLIVGLMLVLLGYASWLSWRIARLQRAVNASVDPDGRILANIPPSRARDELGELNRQFGHMVERLQGYTDYLESFSRRLSHELKTPVAVIRSSLDNLDHATSDEERASYRDRARSATDRLSQILQGMSEAARLEQSFDQAEPENFDLAEVMAEATAAYQSLDPDHQIRYRGPAHGCPITGSPELMVQLLDKLVDNARDFTPVGGQIVVSLVRAGPILRLSVFNEGPALPEALARDIFNPFVSVREGSGEGHLGQGLLIVRLIAEHHGGSVRAGNHADQGVAGVRFEVDLPGADA